jgi:hypothetical protein
MWQKPFGYPEYTLVGTGLVVIGLMLQLTVGAIDWSLIAFPANVIMLCAFVALLIIIHLLRNRAYFFKCLGDKHMAVVALSFVVVLTVIMGLIKQNGGTMRASQFPLGFNNMLRAWWYVLPFLWLSVCLGATILKRCVPFHLSNVPFLLNHLGLLIVIVCGTLGSADVQQLNMLTFPGKPEWRAVDDKGQMHDLPLAIELQQFTMDEYPARLMIINNSNGDAQPKGKPQMMTTTDKTGHILDWNITVNKYMDYAAPVEMGNYTRYVGWGSSGATEAALITATNAKTHQKLTGWISCGSYVFPFHVLKLNNKLSLVMAEREPKRFASTVKIYTQEDNTYTGTIEVNKPMNVMGWKIYQLDYDKEKGRWSEMSVFKLIKDPWLPAVYAGIFMMLAGAVGLFLRREK